jgi:restriction system protein
VTAEPGRSLKLPYKLTAMRNRRLLRQRFRDESTVAVLMDFPRSRFIGLMVGIAALGLLIAVAFDLLSHRPNLLVTVLTPILTILFCVGLYWIAIRERLLRRRRLEQVSSSYQLLALLPDELADMASELFRLQGYVVTENKRPDLPDGGVDFEIFKQGKTWLVQVKHWRTEVTVREPRELWGLVASESAAGGVLIGTSGFSAAAREFAEGKELRLIDGPEFLNLRSQITDLHPAEIGDPDPLISEGFARHFAATHHPACPRCGKRMVLVTRLEDTVIANQFWGCQDYPACEGTRRFAFPYFPTEAGPVANVTN